MLCTFIGSSLFFVVFCLFFVCFVLFACRLVGWFVSWLVGWLVSLGIIYLFVCLRSFACLPYSVKFPAQHFEMSVGAIRRECFQKETEKERQFNRIIF